MSSMVRPPFAVLTSALLFSALAFSTPALAQGASEWDAARARLVASQRGTWGYAIERWKLLSGNSRFRFYDYSAFVLTYPGFPEEEKLRTYAEQALDLEPVDASRVVAFFDRNPPLTNPARAHYAMALGALRRPEARDTAIAAWRGGPMSDSAMATLFATYAGSLTAADHDARMDALLWQGASAQAERQLPYVTPAARTNFMARLAMLNEQDPAAVGIPVSGEALRDPGYVYNRVRMLRRNGNSAGATYLLATRPNASKPALEQTKWVSELLGVARGADSASAVRIASSIDDAFAPGTDLSKTSFKLRDDYTSLMWLGGTQALVNLRNHRGAAPLFYRYGAAAKTPYTRAKGFYWAGRSAALGGDRAGSQQYFEMAAASPDNFYGLLALERLGRPIPNLAQTSRVVVTPAERRAFNARPLTAAVREVARDHEWRTTIRFFKEIADRAVTESDHLLVAELARETGRRDLAVVLGQAAQGDGFSSFHSVAFPTIPVPAGADWTMVHAITRQESQFAMNAVSHAGARGLMQLMPGTAREQAGKIGLSYQPQSLMNDATYNIQLGNAYFRRMVSYYNGSYPLAVAAYNAGPGNVNKWLRANGDPRQGGIEWIDWIERIPLSETRNYVQRVLENAVVYEAMHPDRARYRGPNPLSRLMGKRTPG